MPDFSWVNDYTPIICIPPFAWLCKRRAQNKKTRTYIDTETQTGEQKCPLSMFRAYVNASLKTLNDLRLLNEEVTVVTAVAHIFNFQPISVGGFIIPCRGNSCQGGVYKMCKMCDRWEYCSV